MPTAMTAMPAARPHAVHRVEVTRVAGAAGEAVHVVAEVGRVAAAVMAVSAGAVEEGAVVAPIAVGDRAVIIVGRVVNGESRSRAVARPVGRAGGERQGGAGDKQQTFHGILLSWY